MFVFCSNFARYSLTYNARTALFLCLAIYGYFGIIFKFAESIAIRIRKTPLYFCKDFKSEGNVVVSRLLYSINQMFLSFLFAVNGTMGIFMNHLLSYPPLLQIFHLIYSINIILSITIFFQLLPFVGIYIIAVRHMLRELLNFILLFLLWVAPFSFHLMWSFNTNFKKGCMHEFSNMGESTYSTFRMMNHMLDVTRFDVHSPHILQLVHVVVTTSFTPMFMMNFAVLITRN